MNRHGGRGCFGELAAPPDGIEEKLSALTNSERKVLGLIAAGLSSAQIAERNHLSVRTIHSHRQNICRKLGLSGINSLIRFASQHRETLEQA
ncbi:LuxR C-terminal-related transcriptional regulator [Salaquimonas pukyongi]|uniref:LuxR C-terminal-related transcriptional regulator n=1 Tax=Salaquimonas pukyongi TaxID=2712698 RepID=UPI0009F9186F